MFAEHGHKVKFVSLTNGDCGHYEQSGDELVQRRIQEAQEAAKHLGVLEYEVLDTPDGELVPDVATKKEVIRQIRRWEADIVISFHPDGGAHSDNRYAGKLVHDASAFIANTPNMVPEVPALRESPLFLLMPDYSMNPHYTPDIVIDTGSVIEKKLRSFAAHASQFYEFAPWQGGFLDEVPFEWEEQREFLLKNWAEFIYASDDMRPTLERLYGKEHAAGVTFAEPFEIASYGRRPSDEELKNWFPWLNK